jgi:hypothetical protein
VSISGIKSDHLAAFYELKTQNSRREPARPEMQVQFQGRIHSLTDIPYSQVFTVQGRRWMCRSGSTGLETHEIMRKLFKILSKLSKEFLTKAAEWVTKAGSDPWIRTCQKCIENTNADKNLPGFDPDPWIKKNVMQMGTDPDSWIQIGKILCGPQIPIGSVGMVRIPSFGSLSLKLLHVWMDFRS